MYEKTTWANGDIITAEKLNHIENGIIGNNFIIREIFNEESGEYEYISDSVFDSDVQYDHMWFIDVLGKFNPLTNIDIGYMSFGVFGLYPGSDPSFYVTAFDHDADDDTNLKYIKTDYSASLQFVSDD